MIPKKKQIARAENFIVVSSGEWVGMFDFNANLLAQMKVDENTLESFRKKREQEEEED